MRRFSGHMTQTAAALALLLAGSGVAQAQLDEIVVTAERRANNLQDVPVAVTALSAEDIERTGIHDPATLQFKVPNFNFSAFSPGQNVFSLRGISSNDDGAGTENSIAVFLDDVYFGRISNAAFDFFDVEQVEVLRGPQGTLWGKNAIGGTINITSKKPSMDKWSSKTKITVGDYGMQNFGGYVTGPINDRMAIKVAYNRRNREGFVENVLNTIDQSGQQDLLNEDIGNYRAQLMYEVADTTTLLLTASRQVTDNNDIARMPIPNQNSMGPGAATRAAFVAAGGNENELMSANPAQGFARGDSDVYSLKAVHDTGVGELTYIFAQYDTLSDWEMDSVGAGATQLALIDDIYDETEATSHELRWSNDFSDMVSLVAGAFYLSEDTDRRENFRIIRNGDDRLPGAAQGVENGVCTLGPSATDTNPNLDCVDGYRQINETESIAVFANVDWQFAPDWRVSAGARWTRDQKEIVSWATNGFTGFIINSNFGPIEDSNEWENVSPKISLNWQPEDNVLVYGSYAEGFKSGGFGAAPATEAEAMTSELDPEEARTFEIGLKTELLDNTLRLNVAAFHTDYEDLQIQRFGPLMQLRTAVDDGAQVAGTASFGDHGLRAANNCGPAMDENCFGQFRSVNAGEAEITGVELEATWAVNDALTLNGSYGYLDTEQEVDYAPFLITAQRSMGPLIRTIELNRAPKNQYTFGAVYEQPLPVGALVFSADFSHSDAARGDVFDDFSIEDERQLIDARIAYVNEDAGWTFSVWGKNLTDERYFQHTYSIGPGVIGKLGDPRVLGVSLTMEY